MLLGTFHAQPELPNHGILLLFVMIIFNFNLGELNIYKEVITTLESPLFANKSYNKLIGK